MSAIDEMRRWVKDQMSRDEQITVRPKQSIIAVWENLDQMTAKERNRSVEHVRAYADLYYQGRHNEAVPDEIKQQIKELSKRAERLNVVDAARAVVEQYGGPPTRATVREAIERSQEQRAAMNVEPARKTKEMAQEQAVEKSMGMAV